MKKIVKRSLCLSLLLPATLFLSACETVYVGADDIYTTTIFDTPGTYSVGGAYVPRCCGSTVYYSGCSPCQAPVVAPVVVRPACNTGVYRTGCGGVVAPRYYGYTPVCGYGSC